MGKLIFHQPVRAGIPGWLERKGLNAPFLIVRAPSVSSLILGFNLVADGLREMSLRD